MHRTGHVRQQGAPAAVPAFADEDQLTSVILSKVLLLNEDETITDPTILAQLPPRPERRG